MNIYKVVVTEAGCNVSFDSRIGIAEDAFTAGKIVLDEFAKAKLALEIKSIDLIGECQFMQRKLKAA